MTEKKTGPKTLGAAAGRLWEKHVAPKPAAAPPAPAATQRTATRKKTAADAPLPARYIGKIGAAAPAAPTLAAEKVQLSIRFDPALLERARNACAAIPGQTLQGMLDGLLLRECERLEKAHNGGKPFPQSPARIARLQKTAAKLQAILAGLTDSQA